ncbi:MAG: hypothetical protein AB7T49_07015 [Oligoflexales bacterium]
MDGHFQLGVHSTNAKFQEERTGEEKNDAMLAMARLKWRTQSVFQPRDRIILDVRDRYDLFGKLDKNIYQLAPDNRLALRQLAFEHPYEYFSFYYSVGRFDVSEAGILANDGVEVGYRFSDTWRASLFAGVSPADIKSSVQIQPEENASGPRTQGGVYAVYEKASLSGFPAYYVSNALSKSVDDGATAAERVFLFHNSVLTFDEKNRAGFSLDYDIKPEAVLRRWFLSYFHRRESFRAYLTASRIDVNDYLLEKEVRETLPASPFTTYGLRLIASPTKSFHLNLRGSQTTRQADQLKKQEASAGPTFLFSRVRLTILGGVRTNYLSKDNFVFSELGYYSNAWNFRLTYTGTKETYTEEEKVLNVQNVGAYAEIYMSNNLFSSLGYNFIKDEEVQITSGLLTIGYRFGKKPKAPVRDEPTVAWEG